MAAKGNAKAGRRSTGNHDTGASWENGDDEEARLRTPDAGRARERRPLSGDNSFDEEQELQDADRTMAPRHGAFPPLDELSARLNEFNWPVSASGAEIGKQDSFQKAPLLAKGESSGHDRDWFEDRFGELKTLIGQSDGEQKSEIAAINDKLTQITSRLESLSAGMPNETLSAVESQLAELTRSIEAARQESAEDANRISRAASEILAATNRAQDASAGFERAASHTIKELGLTVAVTASRAAVATAEQIASALQRNSERNDISRLEMQLRALNVQSRESGERSEAALERVHRTLSVFLERNQSAVEGNSARERKRASVHMPISAGAALYAQPGNEFGSQPAEKARLDAITLRYPKPSDPNLFKAFEEAGARIPPRKPLRAENNAPSEESPSWANFGNASLPSDEERSLPLAGIAIVATVLLLASAALFYLHTQSKGAQLAPAMSRSAVPPRVGSRSSEIQPGMAKPTRVQIAGIEPGHYQALLNASEKEHPLPSTQTASLGEDLQALETAARNGDREAQFRIGARFLNDPSLDGGAAAAARWFAKAADQGHIEAQFMLASLYERGSGVPVDENHALDLYRKAAAGGHIRSMHNLGVMLSARGTPEAYREAAVWFGRAAASGLTDSQYNLALLYERGLGIQKDLGMAYLWYRQAANSGDKQASQHAEQLKKLLPSLSTAGDSQTDSWQPALKDNPVKPNEGAHG